MSQFRPLHTHIYFDLTLPEQIMLDISGAAHFKNDIFSPTLGIIHFNTYTSCIETSFIHSYSALEAGLAGTRAQSCDRYGSGTLHPGQVLGVVCHCFPPPLGVPTFAARCLYVRNDARDPSSERYNCGREIVQ